MASNLVSIFMAVILSLRLSFAGKINSLGSVPDLEKAMYLIVDGYPCVRLLNLSGEIGCANPGHEKVVAPIVRYTGTDDKLAHSSAVLVSSDAMQNFSVRVSNDPHFAKMIAGVLIESRPESQNRTLGFSPVGYFPQAEFAPYKNSNYNWNPAGSGIMWNRYDYPIFLLSQNSTLALNEIVDKNVKIDKEYPAYVAEFDLVMQTTKTGARDSETCLREQSCLPLGGYSVWSSLPPINISSLNAAKPILLAVASMDSASFFHDRTLGADSPLSGMISLLAAVDALSHLDGLNELNKQLVFLVLTGEAWGYLGSRRFLFELDKGSDAINGLNRSLIEQVLEIGSVGKGSSHGVKTFFAHAGEGSSATKEIVSALQTAGDSLGPENIEIKAASTSNPGIPPSSMMAFLRKTEDSSTSGVVFEEFDTAFTNKFYYSHVDDPSNINTSSIVAAASVVARALYILASNESQLSVPQLNSISVNASLVEELVGCLLACEPGLSCGLVKDFIAPTNVCPNHYVGVLLGSPSATPYPEYVDDTSRFVWNFLADKTSIPRDNSSSTCSQGCANAGEVCVGAETDHKGICVVSTTRYVPAYSTRVRLESGIWTVVPVNASDAMGAVDPVWTESFWNTIGLRVYAVQSKTYDNFVLVGGIAITVAAYLAIIISRALFMKALKRD